MKTTIFFILLSFVFNCTFAQTPGYVINSKGDTLRCEVKNTFFGMKYRLNGNLKKIKINDIQEYQVTKDSNIFRAEILKESKKPEFVQLLERGKICLYEQIMVYTNGTTTYTSTNWYVSKNNGSLYNLKTNELFTFTGSHNERKSALGDMFSDNPQIKAAYIAENSFSFKNIRKYIQQYNNSATNQTAAK